MSNSSFQELKYNRSHVKIAEATDRAILIIKEIYHTVPAALPFLLEPSALLLFANQRAESPYHQIGDALNSQQYKKLDTILAKHNIYRFIEKSSAESNSYGEEWFSLVSTTMLNTIPNRYEFIKDSWTPLNLNIPLRYAYIEWNFIIERTIADLMDGGSLPKEWLKDWWSPHNLRFGMLLGYPGEAISSMLWSTAYEYSSTSKGDALSNILVAIDEQYFGAQVSFEVNRAATGLESIVNTKDMWKNIIAKIYNDIPFSELITNKDFERGYKSLEQRETS